MERGGERDACKIDRYIYGWRSWGGSERERERERDFDKLD